MSQFSRKITPFVESEIQLSQIHFENKDYERAFQHLENAHVLGQESTWWHVKVHVLMFKWAFNRKDIKEMLGQVVRIVGAATKTAIGLVPIGNTGGTNISPFKPLPLKPDHQAAIKYAKESR